jgi:hypothetical protein
MIPHANSLTLTDLMTIVVFSVGSAYCDGVEEAEAL